MKSFLLLAAIAVAAQFTPQAHAKAGKEPLRLAAKSKWVADYQDDACRLVREFGEGETYSIFILSSYSQGEAFRLTLAGEPFKLRDNGDLTVQFGPNEAEQKVGFYVGKLGEKMPALIAKGNIRLAPLSAAEQEMIDKAGPDEVIEFAPVGAEREKAITQLLVGRPLRRPVILELGRMNKPMEALAACNDNLVASWGIDVAKHKTLKKRVQPLDNPGNWVRSGDYPVNMLQAGQPALVEFRMDISETGAAIGCHIQETTRAKEFDNAVCKSLMKRAKFSPAIDADGQPLRSYWKSRVRFQIPGT